MGGDSFVGHRRGEYRDEVKTAKVVEHVATPLRQSRRVMPARLVESARRSGLDPLVPRADEPPEVDVQLADVQPVPRRHLLEHALAVEPDRSE